ncbi:MAG: AMP-binding protein [Anaerolineaceae bacterium]|nr:AMP-binding protein [Anaerolineaceae bacterium]
MPHHTKAQLFARAADFASRTALIDPNGQYTYQQLLDASAAVAAGLLAGADDLQETRVAFLVPSGFDYVATQWGIWRAGGIAVPLAISHPRPELEYVITDADAATVIAHPEFAERLRPIVQGLDRRFILTTDLLNGPTGQLPEVEVERRAMILYTSGTTGKPKGVVSTHDNIQAQVTALISAWGWTPDDHILHVLPLHHTHGIINVLTCALWSGARCQMLPGFKADEVWQRFLDSNLTLFMAVPTIYNRLIATWEAASVEEKAAMSAACARFRLMVSGSAALPVSVLEQWEVISGQRLLERYGMTEIGMALSNPLNGERVPGFVGAPLPNVDIRLVDDNGREVMIDGTPGEIQVKGPNVFLEYWRRPDATAEAFQDGWFRTGDTAVRENGIYRILGRNSVDIIKTGGYKVSALEIEETLRTHPNVQECAVVGVPDPKWGERVCVALVLKPDRQLTLDDLRDWAKEQLAPYKVPSDMQLVADLPRNAMGKVTKPEVKKLFEV